MSRFLTPEDCNQKREKLHELLPLTNGPFCVRFMVTNVCNFRCYYCRQAEPAEQRAKIGLDHTVMTFEDFKRCIDNLEGFHKFKTDLHTLIKACGGQGVLGCEFSALELP